MRAFFEFENLVIWKWGEVLWGRIEEAAGALEGVITADWNQNTKIMHLEFDSEKVSVEQVELAIAAVGHDTENHRAPDAVYEDLPGCCLYDRPENK